MSLWTNNITEKHYHTHNSTLTEKRAPTDESVKLLAEMEKAAYDRVLSRTRLSNNIIDATWTIFKCPGNCYSTAVCQLKINGKELKMEVSLEDPIDAKGVETAHAKFKEAIIKIVSQHILESCANAKIVKTGL